MTSALTVDGEVRCGGPQLQVADLAADVDVVVVGRCRRDVDVVGGAVAPPRHPPRPGAEGARGAAGDEGVAGRGLAGGQPADAREAGGGVQRDAA